jgi:hypothetical protein
MEEHIEQLPYSDWVDQDLLTRDLARSLLDAEIEAENDRIRRFDAGERGGDLIMTRADMQRRVDVMIAVRDRSH